MSTARPIPALRGEEKQYFADMGEHRLPYYSCENCDAVFGRPAEFCPSCGGAVQRLWSSGAGTVYSYTTQMRAGNPWFADAVPYAIALVDFAEGFRSMADLTRRDGGTDFEIGQRVTVEFEDVTDDITLPHFVVARS